MGTPTLRGHLERLDGQIAIVDHADRPSHHEAGVQVQDRRKVCLAVLADAQLVRIPDPSLMRSVGREVRLQEIRGDGLLMISVRRVVTLADASSEPP